MYLTEYNESETMALMKKEGREEGESRFARLVAELLARGLTEDIQKASADKQARAEMYKKYEIA